MFWNIKNTDAKKIFLFIIIFLVSAFAIASIINYVLGEHGINYDFTEEGFGNYISLNEERTFSFEGIRKIDVVAVSEDINIIPSDEEEIKVYFSGNVRFDKYSPKLETLKTKDSLTIKVKHEASFFSFLNINHRNMKVDVYVPVIYSDTFNLNAVSGDISIHNFDVSTLNLRTISGNMKLEGVSSKNTVLHTTSGRINIDGTHDKLNHTSVSGSIAAEYLFVKDASFGTTSGNIKLNDFTGNMIANSVSGDIGVTFKNFSDCSTNLKTVSGNARLNLPEDSEFYISFKSVSGELKSEFAITSFLIGKSGNTEGYIGNENTNSITANTVSGDLRILKK